MKETWERKMQKNFEPCARAEDMIAYLYGEATCAEAVDFERHMQDCASCRMEAVAFGDVRVAIGEWRQQSLGALASPALEAKNDVTAFASPRETSKPRRSAFAALREFFTLSPVWMRAATAAVALVFCALVVIAIAHFREQSKAVIVEAPKRTNVAPKENTPEVAAGTSNETIGAPKDQQIAPQRTAMNVNKTATPKIKSSGIGSQQLAKRQRQQLFPRSSDDLPAAEIASASDYLPFTSPTRSEEKLPSLIDLGDEPE